MSETQKRHWSRFLLWTLFVTVAVVALWMGYHINWLRERHNVRAWIEAHPASGFDLFNLHRRGGPPMLGYKPRRELPWSLRILGEEPMHEIVIGSAYRERANEIRDLFPEARVILEQL